MLSGDIRGLTQRYADPVEYSFDVEGASQPLNELLGQQISISFTGVKRCIACGRKVNKLFQNGYCFPCVRSLAECDLCIVKPHECHFAEGTCRDESFAAHHCMVPHYVYIAFSSNFKVGLTRKGRELKRWMDQGATEAVLVAEVPTRKMAGEMEMAIAKQMADKTDWRKMLKENVQPDRPILTLREEVVANLDDVFSTYVLTETPTPHNIRYPRMADFTVNLKSMNFDKEPVASGTLRGVKGQYLLFDEGVLNVKKFSGYHVQFEVLS